jgi:hypothetical protein
MVTREIFNNMRPGAQVQDREGDIWIALELPKETSFMLDGDEVMGTCVLMTRPGDWAKVGIARIESGSDVVFYDITETPAMPVPELNDARLAA